MYLISVFTLLFILHDSSAKATHLIGGKLTYEYIGDTSGIPHHYQVNVTVFRTTRWITFSNVLGPGVCLSSSCFPNQSIMLTVAPGTPQNGIAVSSNSDCSSTSSPNYIEIIKHELVGHVVLPGTCSDFMFKYNFLCCRVSFNNVNNYTGGPASGNNRLEAHLNNIHGNNSSPQFVINQAALNLCTNQNISIDHFAIDPDGDSLYYMLKTPRNGIGCDTAVLLTHDIPYSEQQPFPAESPGTIVDSALGNISFLSSQLIGNYVYAFVVEDYRWINGLNRHVRVGSSYIEGWLTISDNCLPNVVNGPEISVSDHPKENFPNEILNRMEDRHLIPNVDTINSGGSPTGEIALAVVEYNCLSSSIDLYFETSIRCNSISTDGSEFRILSPDSVLVPILAAIPHCNHPHFTQHITLELINPLPENGDFLASIRTGNDGNTLINNCGFEMPPHYTFVIQSNDCPVFSTTDYNKGTSVGIRIFPNPNNGAFTVATNGEPHVLRVYNMLGVCVIEENGEGNHDINKEGLSPGNYLVKVEYPLSGITEQKPLTIVRTR